MSRDSLRRIIVGLPRASPRIPRGEKLWPLHTDGRVEKYIRGVVAGGRERALLTKLSRAPYVDVTINNAACLPRGAPHLHDTLRITSRVCVVFASCDVRDQRANFYVTLTYAAVTGGNKEERVPKRAVRNTRIIRWIAIFSKKVAREWTRNKNNEPEFTFHSYPILSIARMHFCICYLRYVHMCTYSFKSTQPANVLRAHGDQSGGDLNSAAHP